jgi:serine/threonine-protein kinase
MVGPFGEVLVMDWGVAKVIGLSPLPLTEGRGGEGTAHGTILGTPGYMAPEQERGEVERIDERTDVWALGALLQFLLGVEEPPRPLEAIRRRAMSEEPEGRYQKVEDLAADLSLYLGGLPVGAHQEGLFEKMGRFTRRYRVPILLILAYLVMRVILILVLGR